MTNMTINKKFGVMEYVSLSGSRKAVTTLLEIMKKYESFGCGIKPPSVGQSGTISFPGVGEVEMHRIDADNCTVKFLHGALYTWLLNLLSRN